MRISTLYPTRGCSDDPMKVCESALEMVTCTGQTTMPGYHAGRAFFSWWLQVSMSSAYRVDMVFWWLVPRKTFKNYWGFLGRKWVSLSFLWELQNKVECDFSLLNSLKVSSLLKAKVITMYYGIHKIGRSETFASNSTKDSRKYKEN